MVTLLAADRAADAAARDRFAAEARVARRVPPLCVAKILDAGFEGGRPYLITESVAGATLAQIVALEGPARRHAASARDRLRHRDHCHSPDRSGARAVRPGDGGAQPRGPPGDPLHHHAALRDRNARRRHAQHRTQPPG